MVREITFSEFNLNYDNTPFLQEAFSTIKNATLVKHNDEKAVILDEENHIFYESTYKIDRDTREVVFKDFAPLSLKEDIIDTGNLYMEAMDEDLNEEDAVSKAKAIAKHITKRLLGGDRSKLVREARSRSYAKKTDKGRKEILEDLYLFKTKNFHIINDAKSKNFYDSFVDKMNGKYLGEDVSVNVTETLNFNFIGKKKDGKGPSFRKKLSLKESLATSEKLLFNPADILRNSPTFVAKLNKLMNSASVSQKQTSSLDETKEVFTNFASNWPVLFIISEEKHGEFAIKHFNAQISDKPKAREYVKIYEELVASEAFRKAQEKYLVEHPEWTAKKLKYGKVHYNAKIIDGALHALTELCENVEKIESPKVSSYLKFAEESIDGMLRTGKFNESLFERLVMDIFGDHRIAINEKEEVFDDKDFREEETISEDELSDYGLEARAGTLVVKIRDTIPQVDRTLATVLEEELELVKSMMAINSIDEKKLGKIEKMLEEIKKSEQQESGDVIEESKQEDAWCPNCFERLTDIVTEATAKGNDKTECPSCSAEVTIGK